MAFAHSVTGETPLHTIFDSASLRELLEDFVVKKMEFGAKKDERTWVAPVAEDQASALAHNPENYAPSAVAMALCVKR